MPRARTSHDTNTVTLPLPPQQVAELLNKASLCERLAVSPRTIENMVNAGAFPPPVRVGKHVYWSEVAVKAWQRRMFAAQEAWTMN